MVVQTWTQRILKFSFPGIAKRAATGALYCSPENIIACLRDKQMLEGLALVVAWGGMARTSQYIYREPLPTIETTMLQASALIVQDQTIQEAWCLLCEELGWSSVMTSKYLHFAARSLGYAINPPVALDNGVVINKVWPEFRQAVEMQMLASNIPKPARWDDGSWAAYNRYMTAINCWAAQKSWSTTQVENTLFAVYK